MKTQPLGEATFGEAVEFVRQGFVDHGRELWEKPARYWSRSYMDMHARACGDFYRDFLQSLIAESGETKLAWDSVSLIAQELLRAGETPPAELAEWVADVLEGKHPRPSKGALPTSRRDRQIYLAVAHVAERFELNPTRRRTQRVGGD